MHCDSLEPSSPAAPTQQASFGSIVAELARFSLGCVLPRLIAAPRDGAVRFPAAGVVRELYCWDEVQDKDGLRIRSFSDH